MAYDCLITSGCSNTFGAEMPDTDTNSTTPSKHAWPSVLAEHIGLDIYNVAMGGGSNDYIIRSIIKEVEKHQGKKILVGIMLTQNSRFEIIKNRAWYPIGTWYCDDDNQTPTNRWIKHYYANGQHDFSDDYSLLKNLHYIQMYLTSKNIDYFIINYYGSQIVDLKSVIADDDFERFEYLIDWSKFFSIDNNIINFHMWCLKQNFKPAPGGHFLKDAHKAFVEQELWPWVKDNYIT